MPSGTTRRAETIAPQTVPMFTAAKARPYRLAGFVQMATGALSGLALGRLHDGSARPMTQLVAMSAVSAALFFALPVRADGPLPARQRAGDAKYGCGRNGAVSASRWRQPAQCHQHEGRSHEPCKEADRATRVRQGVAQEPTISRDRAIVARQAVERKPCPRRRQLRLGQEPTRPRSLIALRSRPAPQRRSASAM